MTEHSKLPNSYDTVYARPDGSASLDLGRWPRSRNEAMVALAARGVALLEIGCGDGEVLRPLAQRYERVTGVELSSARVRHAEACVADLPAATVLEGNVEERLPFDDGTFDCVVWADVVEHVIDVWAAMRELNRVLRTGGRLVTVTPNVAGIRKRLKLLTGRFPSTSAGDEGFAVRAGELFDGGHMHYFTFTSMEAIYRRFGFSPDRRLGIGRFGRLHALRPTLLSGSVAIAGTKVSNV